MTKTRTAKVSPITGFEVQCPECTAPIPGPNGSHMHLPGSAFIAGQKVRCIECGAHLQMPARFPKWADWMGSK